MTIPHVFTAVEEVLREPGSYVIVLSEGKRIFLPLIAGPRVRLIQPGDRILVDFEFWDSKREIAHVCVFRDGVVQTTFGIGKECVLEGVFY